MKNDSIADQVVVRLKRGLWDDPRAGQSVLSCLPMESHLRGNFDDYGMGLIELPAGSSVEDAVRKLTDCPVVEFAEPNFIDRISPARPTNRSTEPAVSSSIASSRRATRKS